MSFNTKGHVNKAKRIAAADAKVIQEPGEFVETLFFDKDGHRGRLAIWEHRMEWEVFTDSHMSQHLDWNHPDCKCLDCLVPSLQRIELVPCIYPIYQLCVE